LTNDVHHAGVFLYVTGLLEVHSDTINEFSTAVLHRLSQVTSKFWNDMHTVHVIY